jgi:hypothetical protein
VVCHLPLSYVIVECHPRPSVDAVAELAVLVVHVEFKVISVQVLDTLEYEGDRMEACVMVDSGEDEVESGAGTEVSCMDAEVSDGVERVEDRGTCLVEGRAVASAAESVDEVVSDGAAEGVGGAVECEELLSLELVKVEVAIWMGVDWCCGGGALSVAAVVGPPTSTIEYPDAVTEEDVSVELGVPAVTVATRVVGSAVGVELSDVTAEPPSTCTTDHVGRVRDSISSTGLISAGSSGRAIVETIRSERHRRDIGGKSMVMLHCRVSGR